MAELQTRLQTLLTGRYDIERELGQGGMAKVFLARDLQHGRRVAIKVFLPEIAAAFGPGRFVREIRTAANLSHPNILALYDSGEGDGLLYYVMPYVEGESLAQRIKREGQLPIPDALAITRQVATALHHAHSRGIVHRDIKPGNILLSGGNAFVADFGIAHALEETGAEKLTSTGFALGTPSYMSPEQSGGYGQLDGRADLYSLGCVLYEMLAGEPPFSGRSAQAVLARHSVERVPSIRAVRETVPWAVEQAIYQALAKSPADRFASGEEFSRALEPERLSRQVPRSRPALRPIAIGVLAAIVALGAIGGALALWSGNDANRRVGLSTHRIAVLPFHAAGSSDAELVRLAAGIADLVAQRFPGEGGPRAAAAGTVSAALHTVAPQGTGSLSEAAAVRVSRTVGAGLLLTGEVVRAGAGVAINATLTRMPGGEVLARVENVSGAPENLGALLDRVVAKLLAQGFASYLDPRYGLAELPLPILRRFLAAREAFLRGDFLLAGREYRAVLSADSSFAPAALGLASSGRLAADSEAVFRGVTSARAVRARLTPADTLYLLALAGQKWPLAPSIPERIALWNRAVDAAPERMEGWYLLGEALFHDGPFTGLPDILRNARAAFTHALEAEPDFVPALGHLLDLAA
ncbi:MAG TPA: serine/threonine-protein kinase, partial [Gemmatimonadales bacterium]|nr:serine/threonine-protein kinase [Gemmatimonadales bacterium]